MVHGAFFAAIANLFTMTFEIKMAAGMNFALIRALNPADGWTPLKKGFWAQKKKSNKNLEFYHQAWSKCRETCLFFFRTNLLQSDLNNGFQSNTSSHWKVLFFKCIFKCTIESTPLKINGGSTCPTMEVWFRWFSFLFMGDGCRFQPLPSGKLT